MNYRNFLKKIICSFKGHTKCDRDTETVSHYIRVPAGYGAFCRDPERYEYDGRLYQCAHCNELLLIHGILQWELEDLLEATLQDLPQGALENAWCFWDYNMCRIYK